jgi:hypothetical protein
MIGTIVHLSTFSNDHPLRAGIAGRDGMDILAVIAGWLHRQSAFTVVKYCAIIAMRIALATPDTLERPLKIGRNAPQAYLPRSPLPLAAASPFECITCRNGKMVGAARFELATLSTPC